MAEGTTPLFTNWRTGEPMPIIDGIGTASITGAMIATGTITNALIATGTITGALIATGTITGSLIAADTITTANMSSTFFSAFSYGSFFVMRETDQTGLDDDAENSVSFTTSRINIDSAYDFTNQRFLPTVPGIYSITVSTNAESSAAPETQQALILLNGLIIARGNYAEADLGVTISSVTAIVQLNGSTDFIQAGVFVPAGVTTLIGEETATYMTCNLIAALP